MNFRDDLTIDKHNLDEELVRQPELYAFYCELLTKSITERDRAKINLDKAYATVHQVVREKAEEESKKLTKDAIHSLVITEDAYIQAQDEYFEAKETCSLLEVARAAFEQRKSTLIKLTDLYQSGYYSRVNTKWSEIKHSNIKKIEKARVDEMRQKIIDSRKKNK